jgi:hypothetical protein
MLKDIIDPNAASMTREICSQLQEHLTLCLRRRNLCFFHPDYEMLLYILIFHPSSCAGQVSGTPEALDRGKEFGRSSSLGHRKSEAENG